MKKISLIFVILIVLGIGGLVWESTAFIFLAKSPNEVTYELKPGVSFSKVAADLESKQVISNRYYFKLLARLMGKTTKIRVGEYRIPAGSKAMDTLAIIVSGKSIEFPITIQEGLNMYEIAQIVERNNLGSSEEFLKICRNKNLIRELLGEDLNSFEGYLYPNTYNITKFTTMKDLVRKMVKTFISEYNRLQSVNPKVFKRHHLAILASIVEKETGSPDDRGKISSVFHNRIKKKMRLQSDPTILYGILDKTGVSKKNITKKDINAYTRYNTYRVNGLPYGPISNPGKAALQATLNPENTEFLYFVSRNDGTTQFSRTYKEHSKAVHKFQISRKGRQGKSWRDLNKRKSN